MTNQSEAFSRILIDEKLTYSGWDLHDLHQVRFEYHVKNERLADQERVPTEGPRQGNGRVGRWVICNQNDYRVPHKDLNLDFGIQPTNCNL